MPAPVPTTGKEKQKEVWFDHILKKPSDPGLNMPFRFDILAQLANIPARITKHELLRLSKETREELGMHWLTQNYFLHICQKPLRMTLSPLALNVIIYS